MNVKDTGNEKYVYDITLKEADSLPNSQGFYDGSFTASKKSISSKDASVNSDKKVERYSKFFPSFMIKTVNAPVMIGEYAGFKMAVSFDSFNHKFVMNLKGQLSHNLEIGVDPLGNIARINHALESMTKELAEATTKLENVEHQLETAKVEVTKPFAQEAELTEKLDRLSALNALLNMDEKGDEGIGMDDDVPEQGTERTETFGQNVQKSERVADKPVQRVSLKERLAEMQIRAAGGSIEKGLPQKTKGTEVSM